MTIENSARKIIEQKIQDLTSAGFVCSPIDKKNYNFDSTIIKNKQKFKLQVYFGKKGVKTVLQGNSDSEEYIEAQNIILENLILQFNRSESKDIEYNEYIGTDETGKGDYFGPLVVAGMYVNEKIKNELVNLGVRDSKELGDVQINKIANQIEKKYKDYFSVIVINPEKYNQLYESFKNVNKLLNWAHSKVIENLLATHQVKFVITDQFSKSNLNISNKMEFSNIEFIQMPRAEKHIGVAAASILARHKMNIWFDKHQNYKVIKGASQDVKERAKLILIEYGKEKFNKLVKLHFKTTLKITEEISKT